MENLPTEILTVIGEYIPMGKTKKERLEKMTATLERLNNKKRVELIEIAKKNPILWGFEKYKETEKSLIIHVAGFEKGNRFSKDHKYYKKQTKWYTLHTMVDGLKYSIEKINPTPRNPNKVYKRE